LIEGGIRPFVLDSDLKFDTVSFSFKLRGKRLLNLLNLATIIALKKERKKSSIIAFQQNTPILAATFRYDRN